VLVEDTLQTLQEIALLHRSTVSATVLGITGSNGKTSTKELIASVLSTSRKISFTQGNYNNHIGVPISVLHIRPDDEIAVIEMGANHVGEIAALSEIAQPDVGIITNIGKAHLEGFGGYEGVKKAKSELYQYLRKNNGMVIRNANDPLLTSLSEGIHAFTYGTLGADITGELTASVPTLSIAWQFNNEQFSCQTTLYGKYNLWNVLAAIASGIHFGISPIDINKGVERYVSENNRSQHLKTEKNTLFLDAYNANPYSMKEAIESFSEYARKPGWLILGDMFEMGDAAREEHLGIIRILQEKAFENVILVGEEFKKLATEAEAFMFFETTDEAAKYLENNPLEQADILIKGSRGMQLERLVKHL
jgi:UDP-N-acetylmuramoyl-tripeptide--D-alanyl-D-alanine ligase